MVGHRVASRRRRRGRHWMHIGRLAGSCRGHVLLGLLGREAVILVRLARLSVVLRVVHVDARVDAVLVDPAEVLLLLLHGPPFFFG